MASSPTPLDPFDMWRQMFTKFEGDVNSLATKNMSTDQFTQLMGGFAQSTTGLQQAFDKALDAYFKALRLPSRQDVAEIADTLRRLEDKIDMLLPIEQREPIEHRPARTRKPATQAEAGPAAIAPASPKSDG
jgi:hypothetical protein